MKDISKKVVKMVEVQCIYQMVILSKVYGDKVLLMVQLNIVLKIVVPGMSQITKSSK
jgi:hypothetical protein